MIEICQHCFQLKECELVGRVNLCNNHKDLKQYQPKEKKKYQLKRSLIKVNSDYKIPKESKKQKKKMVQYTPIASRFKKENPVCDVQIEDVCTFNTSDVHHRKGKVGYADSWARENNVPLLIDTRYFEPVCRSCHDYIEAHPEWAYENGYSETRVEKKDGN